MIARAVLSIFVLILLVAMPAAARGLPDGLEPGAEALVASVVDGDTVVLEAPIDGSSQVRLVGLQAPNYRWGGKIFPSGRWRLNPNARLRISPLANRCGCSSAARKRTAMAGSLRISARPAVFGCRAKC